MQNEKVKDTIVDWLFAYANKCGADGYVIGVSGGVDSALVSTLCAMTGLPTVLVQMPIHRTAGPISERAQRHCDWLKSLYPNVIIYKHDLSAALDAYNSTKPWKSNGLADANTRSRLRMISLRDVANTLNCLVAGTGNKVEDFGVGFFTKGGDGCVDNSPIGDLLKSQVRDLASYVGVSSDITTAAPTDELWADCRSDEQQIGATYDELEWAMRWCEGLPGINNLEQLIRRFEIFEEGLVHRQKEVLKIYMKRHQNSRHKLEMPPVCGIPLKYLEAA